MNEQFAYAYCDSILHEGVREHRHKRVQQMRKSDWLNVA